MIKTRLGGNLFNLVRFYSNRIMASSDRALIFGNIREFVEIVNSIFPDSKRNILKKPSFLAEGNTYMHETEILSAKKMRILDKQILVERNHILTIFIRRVLKLTLVKLRQKKSEPKLNLMDIYCIAQVCYEMGNVEEESHISAFYHLLLKNMGRDQKEPALGQEELEKGYYEIRKKYIEATLTPQ